MTTLTVEMVQAARKNFQEQQQRFRRKIDTHLSSILEVAEQYREEISHMTTIRFDANEVIAQLRKADGIVDELCFEIYEEEV